MGVGEAVRTRKKIKSALAELERIAGQKPVLTKAASRSRASSCAKAWLIGCKVTLRRDRMYEFLDRLTTIALPRVQDFRGLNGKSFDGRGNYAMGLKEHIVFPEIDYDEVDDIRGMDIIVCTTADNERRGASELLAECRLPVPELAPRRLAEMAKKSAIEKNAKRQTHGGSATLSQAREAEGERRWMRTCR